MRKRICVRQCRACAALRAVLLVVAGVPTGSAHGASPPTLAAAMQSLQSGDAAHAARDFDALLKREPSNAAAARGAGAAYRQLRDYDHALSAYQRALSLEPQAPQPLLAIAACHAAKGNLDQAFAYLERARATHRLDMTQITQEREFAPLEGDSRFAALLPHPQDFAPPFVEPVKILGEWQGESPNDQFGWIARNLADVDGDHVADFVTSAPTHGAKDSHAGRIYVYSVRTQRLLWMADGGKGDELGTGVESAGDTNRDGVPDVVASGPSAAGVAMIYSGADGKVLRRFESTQPDEAYGNHISGAGDFDDDGFADVIVGSPGKEGEHKVAGHAYVYSGRDGSVLISLAGEQIGDRFGSTVAGRAGDGHHFLIIGAPGAGADHHGRVYVYDGHSVRPRSTIDADASGVALGAMFVSTPGDMDGDGVTEIYASDWSNSARGASTGRIYVHSGASGRRLFARTGAMAGEGFGTSASMAGDVDGDGRADLIVGAWQYAGAAVSGGRAYLYSGRDGTLIKTFTSRIPGDTLGFDAVGVGDVDGDGRSDLLITAAWSAVHGFHSGRVFLISSGVKPAN